MSIPTIFITGITGCQGGAVAREALAQGWAVRAVARDPGSAAATVLAARGAAITRGDWDDEAALARGLTGCDCLFLNLFPSFTDPDAEARQGRRILRLARAAGVRHAIYSSLLRRPADLLPAGGAVAGGPLPAGADGFLAVLAGKAAVDDAVRTNAFGFPHWTVLRPGFFMANMLAPKCHFYGDFSTTGTWVTALGPADALPLVDHADVARFALAAARDPAAYHAREVPVASELRTPAALLAAVGAAAGKTLHVRHFRDDAEVLEAATGNPVLLSQLLTRSIAAGLDLEAIRAWGVPLTTLEDFLRRENQSVMETYASL